MNLQSIAADLRATGLEWAAEAANYLDQCTTWYAAQVHIHGEWWGIRYSPLAFHYMAAVKVDDKADWEESPDDLQFLLEHADHKWPEYETRIVRRTVSPAEVVEE